MIPSIPSNLCLDENTMRCRNDSFGLMMAWTRFIDVVTTEWIACHSLDGMVTHWNASFYPYYDLLHFEIIVYPIKAHGGPI